MSPASRRPPQRTRYNYDLLEEVVDDVDRLMSSTLVETVNINFDDFTETFLTCTTCLHLFDQDERKAKLLPCSHSVCQSCLQQIANFPPNNGLSFRCPMCRDAFQLPAGGVTSFPPAFLINQLLDVMQRQRKDVVPSCSVHPQEEFLYCECCDLVFCQHCQTSIVNKKCTEHTVIPFSIALKRMSEIVLYRAKGRLRALDQAHATVSEEIVQLDQNVDKIVEQINNTFQEVCNLVENRRRELIEGVRITRDQKRKVLKDQIEIITDEKKKLEKELGSCQLDVRTMAKQLKSLDGQLDKQLCQPRENAFLKLNTNASQLICDTQRCLSDFGTLTASTTFPGECTVELVDTASVHTESKLLVRTFDLDGKPRSTGGDPICVSLKSDNGTEVGIQINDKNDGTYELIFRVTDSGLYKAHVTIFGREIKNSPFDVSVSSHHQPRWQLSVDLDQPTRVSMSGDNIFYILDTGNSRVRIVKDNGDVLNDVKSPCLEGNSAVGLALNGQDITVLNWRTKTITRIDKKGEELQAVNFSEFDQPIDIALDNRGRYLIADKDKIFVFDSSLRPLFSFPVTGKKVTGVNAGLDDDILVATAQGVILYDGAGRFKRDIPLAPVTSRSRMTALTCSVCPESGLIISGIIDNRGHSLLSVSTYKGIFGFWLDSKGSRLRSPSGIAIGTGCHAGQCFVVDHTTNTLKMYRYK